MLKNKLLSCFLALIILLVGTSPVKATQIIEPQPTDVIALVENLGTSTMMPTAVQVCSIEEYAAEFYLQFYDPKVFPDVVSYISWVFVDNPFEEPCTVSYYVEGPYMYGARHGISADCSFENERISCTWEVAAKKRSFGEFFVKPPFDRAVWPLRYKSSIQGTWLFWPVAFFVPVVFFNAR